MKSKKAVSDQKVVYFRCMTCGLLLTDKIIKEGKTSKLRSPQRDLYEKLIQNIQIFLLPSMKSLRELRDKERERREKTNREEYLEKLVNTNPLQFIIGEVEVDENKEVEVYDDGYMEDDRNLAFN